MTSTRRVTDLDDSQPDVDELEPLEILLEPDADVMNDVIVETPIPMRAKNQFCKTPKMDVNESLKMLNASQTTEELEQMLNNIMEKANMTKEEPDEQDDRQSLELKHKLVEGCPELQSMAEAIDTCTVDVISAIGRRWQTEKATYGELKAKYQSCGRGYEAQRKFRHDWLKTEFD